MEMNCCHPDFSASLWNNPWLALYLAPHLCVFDPSITPFVHLMTSLQGVWQKWWQCWQSYQRHGQKTKEKNVWQGKLKKRRAKQSRGGGLKAKKGPAWRQTNWRTNENCWRWPDKR